MTLPDNPLAWAVGAFRSDLRANYAVYRRYLIGDHPMKFDSEKYRRAFGLRFQNFAYNRCATVVDAHADRLRVVGFGSPDDDARRTAREQAIESGQEVQNDASRTLAQLAQDVWDENRMDTREGHIEKETFGMGDGYLLIEVNPRTGAVHLWPQPADFIRVRYDDTEPGRIELAAKAWQSVQRNPATNQDEERTRLNLYFTDRIEKYRSRTRTPGGMPVSASAFEPYQDPADAAWPVMLNVNDTVPVFHFANNAPVNAYGESELRDVLPLQDALNKSLMDQMVAQEFTAHAQWVLLNYDAADPEAQQLLENLKVGITTMLAIPPNREGEAPPSIAEFSPSDMSQFDLVAEKWDIRISRVSRVPVHHLTMTGDFPSGQALRMAEGPFVTKMEDRQRDFGGVYAAALTYALRLQGIPVEPGALRVNWASAAPMAEEETWDLILKKRDAGMALKSALREEGYEPEQLAQVIAETAAEREQNTMADFIPVEA
jgi:hypothetical protein